MVMVEKVKKVFRIWRKATSVMGASSVKLLAAYYIHRKVYLKFIGKRVFKIKIYGNPFYLRAFSRDVDFAYSILIGSPQGQKMVGEYDIELPDGLDGILDLGANVGLFTVLMATRHPNLKIYSVEPENSNYALLKRNTENLTNVKIKQCGIWWRDAFVKVNPSRVIVPTSNTGSEGAFYVTECEEKEKNAIKGISIESILSEENMKNYVVKMDIEGTEKEIFENDALGWLNGCNMLIMETHERFFPESRLNEMISHKMEEYHKQFCGENVIYRKKSTT